MCFTWAAIPLNFFAQTSFRYDDDYEMIEHFAVMILIYCEKYCVKVFFAICLKF